MSKGIKLEESNVITSVQLILLRAFVRLEEEVGVRPQDETWLPHVRLQMWCANFKDILFMGKKGNLENTLFI